jgi:hypothetical protein
LTIAQSLSGGDDAEGNAMSDQGKIDQLCDISYRRGLEAGRAENERLRAYAEHMRGRYQAYRDHYGTEGTYPHPASVALLDAALAVQQSSSGSK